MTEEQCAGAFSSLLSTTKPHGTGLGLAIVHRVVETHRGEMTVKSRPGRGTTMAVALPAG
jgi:signal transduction histidine kinase